MKSYQTRSIREKDLTIGDGILIGVIETLYKWVRNGELRPQPSVSGHDRFHMTIPSLSFTPSHSYFRGRRSFSGGYG